MHFNLARKTMTFARITGEENSGWEEHEQTQPASQLKVVERPRVAIVHDWLYTIGGAERVLSAMLRAFPGAAVYALFDTLTEDQRAAIGHTSTHTSFLQGMPCVTRWHRL